MRYKLWSNLLTHALLILLAFLVIAPVLFVINTSLKDVGEFYRNTSGLVQDIRWENYVDAYKMARIGEYFKNSVLLTSCSAVGVGLVAAMAAFPISRRLIASADLLYAIFTLSIFLPGGLIPLYGLMRRTGLLYTYHGFVLMKVAAGVPISIFILSGFLKGVPQELDEAAIVDGCGPIRLFFRIILPILKPAVSTVMMLTALSVWNDFLSPFIFLRDSQRTLPTGLFTFQGMHTWNWPLLMAGTLIVLLPILIVYIFLQRYIIEGTTAGALKG